MNVKYHSYIIVPLKFNEKVTPDLEPLVVDSMDFTENVKELFKAGAPSQMCSAYQCPPIVEGDIHIHREELRFNVTDSYLFVFRTKVAFLALGVAYDAIETLQQIRNPGYNETAAVYFNDAGQGFDFEGEIEQAKVIAESIKESGWEFASHTWGHLSVTNKTVDELRVDNEKWVNTV